jgi:kinesin family protein 22
VQTTTSAEGAPAILLRDDAHENLKDAAAAGGNTATSETMFTFDGVYEPTSSNRALFDAEVGPHLGRLFTGSSVTLFAFGMTGTGKSHTMQGTAADPGLIPRAISGLFDALGDRVATGEQEWESTNINFSFFELYNEKIYDLLKPYTPPTAAAGGKQLTDRSSSDSAARADPLLAGDLPVREDGSGKVFVSGLSESRLESVAAFSKLYAKGLSNRRVAATKLNAVSSRSHSMAIVKIDFRSTKAPFKKISARIQMLDLAGK